MTSKSEKFFTWIWRANGLIIFVAVVGCLIALVILATEITGVWRDNSNSDQLAIVSGVSAGNDALDL